MVKDTSHIRALDGTHGVDSYALECQHCGTKEQQPRDESGAIPMVQWINAAKAFEKEHAKCPAPKEPPGFSAKEWEARYISERGVWTREVSALRVRAEALDSEVEYLRRALTLVGDLVAKAPEHAKYTPDLTFRLKR